jgi:hypothetical protein
MRRLLEHCRIDTLDETKEQVPKHSDQPMMPSFLGPKTGGAGSKLAPWNVQGRGAASTETEPRKLSCQ